MEAEIGKDKVKIPFNSYDLFGYAIPGVVALIAIYLFEYVILNDQPTENFNMPLFSIFNSVSKEVIKVHDWALSVSFALLMLIIIYVVGHIVSSVSSFCLDRVLVNKGSGYPYLRLLKFKTKEGEVNWDTGPYYRGLFFWINVYLIVRYFDVVYRIHAVHNVAQYLGCCILAVIFMKLVISYFRSRPAKVLQEKIPALIKTLDIKLWGFFLRYIFAGLYDFVTRLLSHFVNTRAPLSDEMIDSYKRIFDEKFQIKAETAESENYWFCTCYVADKSPTLNAMVVNWFHMYSYARNIATAFYLAYLYAFLSLALQQNLVQTIHNRTLLGLPLLFLFLALVMQSRYYYLYVSYYSKFLFRSFVYLNKVEKP